MRRSRSLVIALCALVGCAPGVPDAPSYQLDVAPILTGNCVLCHGYPSIRGVPHFAADFRLDAYEAYASGDPVPDPMSTPADPKPDLPQLLGGAHAKAEIILLKIVDTARPMPPRFPLDPYQVEILQRWVMQGAERGEARPDNHDPTIKLERLPRGSQIALHLTVDDVDGDAVSGNLRVPGAVPDVLGPLRSGPQDILWTRPTATGTYSLIATLDDGAVVREIVIDTVVVSP